MSRRAKRLDSGTPQRRPHRFVVLSWNHWLVVSLTLFVFLAGTALAFHSFLDEFLWEQGVAFADRLREVGAVHELYRLDGAPHGMESWEGRPEWAGYKRRVVDWLEENL